MSGAMSGGRWHGCFDGDQVYTELELVLFSHGQQRMVIRVCHIHALAVFGEHQQTCVRAQAAMTGPTGP
jgi:hypothetical protein